MIFSPKVNSFCYQESTTSAKAFSNFLAGVSFNGELNFYEVD